MEEYLASKAEVAAGAKTLSDDESDLMEKFDKGLIKGDYAQSKAAFDKLMDILPEEDIQKMKADAEANADADKKAKETAEKINGADAMIFQTESQLKEFGEKLSADKKAPIESSLEELKKAHESKDLALIDAAMEKINEAWKAASEEIYKAQQESQAGGPQPGADAGAGAAGDGEPAQDDVQDVDFEEVKED